MFTRRALLTGASLFVLSQSAAARDIKGAIFWKADLSNPPTRYRPDAKFFTDQERAFISAAVDRLIPADETPSASEVGVVVFLENQLSGAYGRGDIYYMQGPFRKGEPTQGYQQQAPGILYKQAIADIEAKLKSENRKPFASLSAMDQDRVLHGLSEGKIDLEHVDAKTFFDILWQDTQLGFFGDPVYGGNREMAGWKMVGFPGARYDYRPYINHNGRKLSFEPVSVAGNFSQGSK